MKYKITYYYANSSTYFMYKKGTLELYANNKKEAKKVGEKELKNAFTKMYIKSIEEVEK